MQLAVPTSKDGFLLDKYAKGAQVKKAGQPIISFPVKITGIPQAATGLALSLIDYDAVPRTGFPFIHWLAANLPAASIPEDFSRTFQGPQGMNSWSSRFYDQNDQYVISHYAGPVPPDKPHRYTLTIYVLRRPMKIANRFFYNDFRDELANNELAKASLILMARASK